MKQIEASQEVFSENVRLIFSDGVKVEVRAASYLDRAYPRGLYIDFHGLEKEGLGVPSWEIVSYSGTEWHRIPYVCEDTRVRIETLDGVEIVPNISNRPNQEPLVHPGAVNPPRNAPKRNRRHPDFPHSGILRAGDRVSVMPKPKPKPKKRSALWIFVKKVCAPWLWAVGIGVALFWPLLVHIALSYCFPDTPPIAVKSKGGSILGEWVAQGVIATMLYWATLGLFNSALQTWREAKKEASNEH